jgi:multiple antibiotic resistance protein
VSNLNEYLRFVVTLAAVVDPFLAVPMFVAFTASHGEAERRRLAQAVAITVFAVLSVSAFIGETLLELIGASLPAFRVGGGLVLLLMALAMLNAQAGGVRQSRAEAKELEEGELQGVVPLAIPLLAGPGAISTSIIAAEGGSLAHQGMIVLCIGVVCLVAWLVLRAAHRVAARMGTTGLNVATRILGLLLAAMAVQTMAVGLKQLLPGLG